MSSKGAYLFPRCFGKSIENVLAFTTYCSSIYFSICNCDIYVSGAL